jgi:hypothetical protein
LDDAAVTPDQRIADLEEAAKAARENLEQARAALRMIREAIETHGWPGLLPPLEQTGVLMTDEAEAIVAAIVKLADTHGSLIDNDDDGRVRPSVPARRRHRRACCG